MNLSGFNYPTTHPFETFGKVEIEAFMWWFLKQCFEAGDLGAEIVTPKNEDHLVKMGLLVKVGECRYYLTKKSKDILHSVYGKNPEVDAARAAEQ